jgi:hypothetical protein
MLSFDTNGFIVPYAAVACTIDTLYDQFVSRFPISSTRATLFHEWTKYNRLLRREVGVDFEQWIDGSFISSKLNPKDIDVVSFIPFAAYDRHEAILDKFWSDTWGT